MKSNSELPGHHGMAMNFYTDIHDALVVTGDSLPFFVELEKVLPTAAS